MKDPIQEGVGFSTPHRQALLIYLNGLPSDLTAAEREDRKREWLYARKETVMFGALVTKKNGGDPTLLLEEWNAFICTVPLSLGLVFSVRTNTGGP
ncbi:MAG: hypothetical protein PHU03_07720 [Syntrophales bacterium]|nr:hypothetical protein [Syntrophales bacterium]